MFIPTGCKVRGRSGVYPELLETTCARSVPHAQWTHRDVTGYEQWRKLGNCPSGRQKSWRRERAEDEGLKPGPACQLLGAEPLLPPPILLSLDLCQSQGGDPQSCLVDSVTVVSVCPEGWRQVVSMGGSGSWAGPAWSLPCMTVWAI